MKIIIKKIKIKHKDEQEKKQEEDQNGLDGDYDLNESIMDEQLVDTDSDKSKY